MVHASDDISSRTAPIQRRPARRERTSPSSAMQSCRTRMPRTYLEGLGVGTNDLLDSLTLVEEDEGGHGLDANLSSDLLLGVDVDLVEAELLTGGGVRDLLENGANDPAGTTPGGPEVDDDGLLTVDLRSSSVVLRIVGRCKASNKEGERKGLIRNESSGSVAVQCCHHRAAQSLAIKPTVGLPTPYLRGSGTPRRTR